MNIIRTLSLLVLALFLFSSSLAQHPLDRFLGSAPVVNVIGTSDDGLDNPADLDFCRIPGRTNELWVLNRELGSSSMTIFFHAGTPNQVSQYRKDSHSDHFMIYASAMAMGANGNFGTVQEVRNSLGSATSTFMGPVLWMSDTSVFARMYQSNWQNGQPLGSHIDMLHQSPFSMGIAADRNNIYWVFDGYNGNLVKYDFATPHTIGGDDHADGRVWRYPEVELERVPNLPAHMVLDSASGWLYIVDNANSRIIRVDTKTGVKAKNLTPKDEPLALYWEMKNVTWEVYVDTGLVAPVGIDIWNGRLVVTDNDNGSIRLYDATGVKGTYLGSIGQSAPGIMGVKIGPDSNIWYVQSEGSVVRLSPAPALGVITPVSPPNNATGIETGDTLRWTLDEGEFAYLGVLLEWGNQGPISQGFQIELTDHFVLPDLIQGSRYKWRVIGFSKDSIEIAYSQPWWFTAGVEPPGIPVLISPPDLSTNIKDTVTLVWDASQDATHYQVQLSKQSDFATLDLTIDSTVALSQFVSALAPNTQYHWRVRALNELTNSNWTPAWSFTTATSSVRDEEEQFAVSIFPNPMHSLTTVMCTLPKYETVKYELINILGVTVLQGASTSSTFTIDRNGMADGTYMLKLRTGDREVTRTVLVTQ